MAPLTLNPSSRKPSRRRGYPGPGQRTGACLARSRIGALLACGSHRSVRDDRYKAQPPGLRGIDRAIGPQRNAEQVARLLASVVAEADVAGDSLGIARERSAVAAAARRHHLHA